MLLIKLIFEILKNQRLLYRFELFLNFTCGMHAKSCMYFIYVDLVNIKIIVVKILKYEMIFYKNLIKN